MKLILQLDSNDYNMYNIDTEEYVCFNYSLYNADLEYFKNTADRLLSNDRYLLSGSAGLWSGIHEYDPQVIEDLDDFFDSMSSDIDHLLCKLYGDGSVEIVGTHHDGSNHYTLTPLLSLPKSYLRDLVEQSITDSQDRKDINEYLRRSWECTISTSTKPALVDTLISYIGL